MCGGGGGGGLQNRRGGGGKSNVTPMIFAFLMDFRFFSFSFDSICFASCHASMALIAKNQ